jgi:hypothetical protein
VDAQFEIGMHKLRGSDSFEKNEAAARALLQLKEGTWNRHRHRLEALDAT